MKIIFICGPYRETMSAPSVSKNIANATEVAVKMWSSGHAAICPHLNTRLFEYYNIQDQAFLAGYLEILERCDAVVALPGWRDSDGATDEVNQALLEQIPVYDMTILTVQEILEDLQGSGQRDMATMLTSK